MTYTLETDSIRMMVVNYQLQRSKDTSEDLHPTEVAWSACEMFDRWLAEHDREVAAKAWREGQRANGYLFGHDYDCAGYSDCYCETYINPYTEEGAAIVVFCGDTEHHDSHDEPARGTPDSGWQYLPAHTCPGFFQCDECYEVEYAPQPNHVCREEA